jgi:hypothetical protein
MTIGWEPAESTADLPRDSGLVFPEARMTVGWKPMLGTSALDWEEGDEEPAPTQTGSDPV